MHNGRLHNLSIPPIRHGTEFLAQGSNQVCERKPAEKHFRIANLAWVVLGVKLLQLSFATRKVQSIALPSRRCW